MSDLFKTRTGAARDAAEVVPFLGMSGRFILSAPFTALCNPALEYTVIALVTIAGAVAQGQDPLNDVYLAQGASAEDYAGDEALNHSLLTLQSAQGAVVTLPTSALLALPDADGVRYHGVLLGVSLSALPETFDLSTLKADVADLVFDRVGVRSSVYLAVVSTPSIVSHAVHTALEAARGANVVSHLSVGAQNTLLQAQNTALIARLRALEAYVARHLTTA